RVCEEDESAQESKDRWAETNQSADRDQSGLTLLRRLGNKAAERECIARDCAGDRLRDLPEEGIDRVRGALGALAGLVFAVLDCVGLESEEQGHREVLEEA